MDLRKFGITQNQVQAARECLNYQPFILSDEIITGVAYSWLHHQDGGRRAYGLHEFVFDRSVEAEDVWRKAYDANRRLATMYDCFLDHIAERFPGCSLADMACNNGYFVVGAALRGLRTCTGFDRADYSSSVSFLCSLTGVDVEFRHRSYDSWNHTVQDFAPHDIVVASQIMQHLSDPLYFLSFVASRAKKALLLFTGMGDTDEFLVYYQQPNRFYTDAKFPVCFDNDVGLSRGLLFKSLDMLGFDEIIEIPWQESWLRKSWYGSQKVLLCMRKSRPYFHHHGDL
ncbi:MAG: hypothetical protein JSS38_05760 [Nitrospira sp.]|nr:hypothetical protein [Nitrospira sp.]